MEYKTIWWEATGENSEPLEDIMSKNNEWEIFKMFLVFKGENEAYRIVLIKKNDFNSDVEIKKTTYKPMSKVEIGDFVICHNPHKANEVCLTKGKRYEVIRVKEFYSGIHFFIIDDNGKTKRYQSKNKQFKVLE